MTDREKLIKLLGDDVCKHDCCDDCECQVSTDMCIATLKAYMADHLIANGVTFATDNNVGRWIIHSSGKGSEVTNWAECSECHVCGSPQWKRCPVCEAKMEVE